MRFMPDLSPNQALRRFMALRLAGRTPCQPSMTGFSDVCADGAAVQPCVHVGHNNSFRDHNAGRGGVRNSRYSFGRSADLNDLHTDPGNGRDCLHGGGRDIRYAGHCVDRAPKQVVRQWQSTAQPCQILLFSSHSPRLASRSEAVRLSCSSLAERMPNASSSRL